MAWPADTKQTFLRDPRSKWKHDGFGHDNEQDVGVREKCFRVGPHSGVDLTGRGPIFSIAGGVVAASEWTTRAGNALVEDVTIPGLGSLIGGSDRVFPVYFHAAGPMLPTGTPTTKGARLGTIGDTGTGTSKGAFHLHLSVARTLKQALSLIRNGVAVRLKGETVAAWADRTGLIDPLTVLNHLDSLDKPDTGKGTEPVNPATIKEIAVQDFIAENDKGDLFLVVINPDPGDRAARHLAPGPGTSTLLEVDRLQGGTGKPIRLHGDAITHLSEELERLADERRK